MCSLLPAIRSGYNVFYLERLHDVALDFPALPGRVASDPDGVGQRPAAKRSWIEGHHVQRFARCHVVEFNAMRCSLNSASTSTLVPSDCRQSCRSYRLFTHAHVDGSRRDCFLFHLLRHLGWRRLRRGPHGWFLLRLFLDHLGCALSLLLCKEGGWIDGCRPLEFDHCLGQLPSLAKQLSRVHVLGRCLNRSRAYAARYLSVRAFLCAS
jgi:hypothetical protein